MIVDDRHAPKRATQPPVAEVEAKLAEAKLLIAEHPLAMVGGAFAIGILLGLWRPRSGRGLVRTALGGLAMALLRNALLDKVTTYAGSWIDMKSREEAATRQREAH